MILCKFLMRLIIGVRVGQRLLETMVLLCLKILDARMSFSRSNSPVQ